MTNIGIKVSVVDGARTIIPLSMTVNSSNSRMHHWRESCVHSECSLHQLSPYIGKLKSSIAHDLIETYSKPGDLVFDPFSGAGTIPLEAALLGRHVFAADISPYAKVLTKGKLMAPLSVQDALSEAESILTKAEKKADLDIRTVPIWVRKFFHPKTLQSVINFTDLCRRSGNDFLMACFLGILHHQRPGFLSFPSSHLVPYLRDRKFPRSFYPEMYEYRELRPRLKAKIIRAFKRNPGIKANIKLEFRQSAIENLTFPQKIDCIITSPPYMNTLDYGRDNRLRLWFLDPACTKSVDNPVTREQKAFIRAIISLATKTDRHLRRDGYCVLIVGERVANMGGINLSKIICQIFESYAPSLKIISVIKDKIPDIRRARKNCRGTKNEHILVFRRRDIA